MQLPAVQPTPTRCPTVSPLAARPTSTTRPTASCPSTAGNRENPQSLSRIERSEWHSPQCSTSTSTSSSPSGPSSTFCRTKLLLAAGATHASIVAIAILRQAELIIAQPRTNGSVGRVGLIVLRIHRGYERSTTAWMALYLCLFGRRGGGSVDRERAAARLCWRQHSLENNFDELLGKGQPRYADQIAGALRPRLGVGFFAHLARDCKRLIDIDDIERLFHHVVEGGPELCQDLCSVGIGHPHLLCHHGEVGRLAGFIERRGRDHGPLVVLAELAGHMDRVSDLDRLCIAVVVFRRHTVIGGLFAIRCGRVRHILISSLYRPARISEPFIDQGFCGASARVRFLIARANWPLRNSKNFSIQIHRMGRSVGGCAYATALPGRLTG